MTTLKNITRSLRSDATPFSEHPRAKYWSGKNKLKPYQVAMNSKKTFRFDCPDCPHNFESSLGNINLGRWCPYCAIPSKNLCGNKDCNHCFKRSFASHPNAEYWSKKNNKNPNEVTLNSNKKFWFDCPDCPHSFDSTLNNNSMCP